MRLSLEQRDRLLNIVGRLCNDELEPGEFASLSELLANDPEARQIYVRYVDMHEALRAIAVPPGSTAAVSGDSILASLQSLPDLHEMVASSGGALSDPLIADAYQKGPAPHRKETIPAQEKRAKDRSLNSSAPPIVMSLANYRTAGWLVFTLLLLGSAGLWFSGIQSKRQESMPIAAPSPIRPREFSTLQIESGTTSVTLPDVGYVILEGPAEFELLSPMRARLSRGKIKVRVTKETGHGFVVETPHGKVIDLGTEFGLDVSDENTTGLVVFEGAVDLQRSQPGPSSDSATLERLVEGEAVTFDSCGRFDRMVSITTGDTATFQAVGKRSMHPSSNVITQVVDNLRTADTKKFYEIVQGRLREDAIAYVDRPQHEWNGVTHKGMPSYLIGADYVKPFCEDKTRRDLEISVTLSQPAKLYVFYDDRLVVPKWLKANFRQTTDKIGLDCGKWRSPTTGEVCAHWCGVGPGERVDHPFSIWERIVPDAGTIKLGGLGKKTQAARKFDSTSKYGAMYGIAAVPLSSLRSNPVK